MHVMGLRRQGFYANETKPCLRSFAIATSTVGLYRDGLTALLASTLHLRGATPPLEPQAQDPVEQNGEPVRRVQCESLTYDVGIHRSGIAVCGRCVDAPPRRA